MIPCKTHALGYTRQKNNVHYQEVSVNYFVNLECTGIVTLFLDMTLIFCVS